MLHRLGSLLLASLAIFAAGDGIAGSPVPMAAYHHPEFISEATGIPVAASPDGRSLVYAVIADPDPRYAQPGYFLPNGTPGVANGETLVRFDFDTRAARAICPTKGNDWDQSWSPDGKHIAFYSDRSGSPRLWLFEVASSQCRMLSDLPAKSLSFPGEAPRWSPDGQTVYLPVWPTEGPGAIAEATREMKVGARPEANQTGITILSALAAAPGVESGATATTPTDDWTARCANTTFMAASLYAVRVSDGAARLLLDDAVLSAATSDARHRFAPYVRVSPSGKWLSYTTTICRRVGERFLAGVDIYVVPAAGGLPVRIAKDLRAPVGGPESDYLQRWNPVSDEIAFLKDGRAWKVSFGPDGPSGAEPLGQNLKGLAPHILRYTADGAALIVGAGNEKNVLSVRDLKVELYRLPTAGGPAQPIMVDSAWSPRGPLVARDGTAAMDMDGKLFVRAVEPASDVVAVLAVDLAKRTTKVRWQGHAQINAVVPTAAGLAAIHEDFALPADLALLSPSGNGTARLTHIAPALDALKPGTLERFETVIPGRTGVPQTVASTIILPPGAKRGDKLPAVVWFYPSRNMNRIANQYGAPAMGDLAHLVTARGYAVLLVDIPLGPDGGPTDPIDEIVDVLLPQVYHAVDLGYVDAKRLALRGQSYGGYATAAIVTRTNLFRAAIPSSGKYDLGGAYAMGEIVRGTLQDNISWSETGQGRMGGMLWSDVQRYIDNSPYYQADKIHTPLLILEGTNDPVGYYDALRLFSALRRLNSPVELALYDGGGHSPAHWRPEHAADQMTRTLDFMDRYLK